MKCLILPLVSCFFDDLHPHCLSINDFYLNSMTIVQLEPAILFDSNIYLVIGDSKTALIDTGTGFQVQKTMESIDTELNGRMLDYVILTHRHFDHVGGLCKIVEKYRPSAVYAGHDDAVPLRNGDSESTLGTMFGGHIDPVDVVDFNEGDALDLGGHLLSPIETPGHTIGSISVVDSITKALFSGDTVFVDGVGNYSHPTGSGDMLIESLKKLKGYEIDGFYPGHGPAVTRGGNEYIEKGLHCMGV